MATTPGTDLWPSRIRLFVQCQCVSVSNSFDKCLTYPSCVCTLFSIVSENESEFRWVQTATIIHMSDRTGCLNITAATIVCTKWCSADLEQEPQSTIILALPAFCHSRRLCSLYVLCVYVWRICSGHTTRDFGLSWTWVYHGTIHDTSSYTHSLLVWFGE